MSFLSKIFGRDPGEFPEDDGPPLDAPSDVDPGDAGQATLSPGRTRPQTLRASPPGVGSSTPAKVLLSPELLRPLAGRDEPSPPIGKVPRPSTPSPAPPRLTESPTASTGPAAASVEPVATPSNGSGAAPAPLPRRDDPPPDDSDDDVDGAVDEAMDHIMGPGAEGSSDQASGFVTADTTAVQATFDDLAQVYVTHVRDLMMELRLGDIPKTWLTPCEPTIQALSEMTQQMQLGELRRGLGDFAAALQRARRATADRIEGDLRERVVAAYDRLVELGPEVFALETERNRREPIIVDGLLRQVPGVEQVTLDALAEAGAFTLDTLYRSEPSDLAAAAGIRIDRARAIAALVQADRASEAGGLSIGRPLGLDRLQELLDQLAASHERLDSASSRAERGQARRDRQIAMHAIRVLMTRLGEVDCLASLERLPFVARLATLRTYLEEARQDSGLQAAVVTDKRPVTRSELTRADVLSRFKAGKTVDRTDLRDLDLSGTDLRGASFRRAELDGVDLGGSRLNRSMLKGASLCEAYLAGADLREASLENADLEGANLSDADLRGADLTRANLAGADLRGARLTGARLNYADLHGANLAGAQLERAVLAHADAEGAYLGGCWAHRADVTGANLAGVILDRADFSAARLDEARIEEADASRARFAGASMVRATLRGTRLVGADLTEADLRHATLTGAELDGAKLSGAHVAGLAGTGTSVHDVEVTWLDTSVDGNGLERLTNGEIAGLLTGLPSPGARLHRYFGRGDVMRNAALQFEEGARVTIESLLEGCEITLGEGAELLVAPAGVLADCVITGAGNITIQGKFYEREAPGIVGPRQIVVHAGGSLVSTVVQCEPSTRFAFEHGCNLRLKIARANRSPQEESRS